VSLWWFKVRVRVRVKYCVRCSVLGVNYICLLSSTLKFPAQGMWLRTHCHVDEHSWKFTVGMPNKVANRNHHVTVTPTISGALIRWL